MISPAWPASYQVGMHFDASRGGADRYFHGLLCGLREIEADCAAFAFAPSGGFDVVPFEKWNRSLPASVSLGDARDPLWRRLLALHRLGRIPPPTCRSVVATHFALYALPLLPSLKGRAHVVHFHGPWAAESAREGQSPFVVAAKRRVERRVYRSARRLIALSSAFRNILVEEFGISEERVKIVPGGVDIERFLPSHCRVDARRHLGWPEKARIIFCVRRLVRRMGLPDLLTAFASIAGDHPDAVLVLAGRGPLEDELHRRAASLGLGGRVFLVGFIPDDDLPLAYAAADFSVVPSESLEGFGLTALESLACGTPVLVTPAGGLPETVTALDPSLVLSGSDVPALASGLQRGLREPLPDAMKCRRYIEARFTWSAIARRVLEVYQEALR